MDPLNVAEVEGSTVETLHRSLYHRRQPAAFRRALLAVSLVATISASVTATAVERSQLGSHAVVTANPLATSAALQMLDRGGSAVDASIAAQLVLGVVEPQSSGIGGGAVVLYRESADGPVLAFDGLARSPSTYNALLSSAKGFSHSGAAVGVPGAVRLMALLHGRYGKLPWSTLFDPAIKIASTGFNAPPYLAKSLVAATKAGFMPPPWLLDSAGAPILQGTLIRNETLATTMREIAQNGPDAFYAHLAPEIVSAVQRDSTPGDLTENDVTNYTAVERAPLCAPFHQMRVCAFPPPSYGGVTVLEMLELLDQLHTQAPDFLNVNFVHAFVEAGRIAEADRLNSIGGPDAGRVSTTPLLNRSYVEKRAMRIDPTHAMKDPMEAGPGLGAPCSSAARPPPPSTTQITIVDKWGAALSMTTTINVNFGSWLTVRGFFLNDALTNFTRLSDSPCAMNRPAGNKRPETSMVPVIAIDKAGQTVLLGGSAGAGEIVDYVAQVVVELAYGTPPVDALDFGHVSTARSPYSDTPGLVELEEGRGVASLATDLERMGHTVKAVPLQSGLGFLKWQKGAWLGAADPRRDGNWATGR